VEPAKQETLGPANSYMIELAFDNDLDQDELNRTMMRKPGAPPYNPNAKWLDRRVTPPNGAAGDPVVPPIDSTKEVNEG
jgi:hypothetical protein